MKTPETTTTGTGETAAQFVTLKKGWGYWDVTSFPHGGSFHRATENMTGRVINGPANLYGQGLEYSVVWDNGRSAVIPARGILQK